MSESMENFVNELTAWGTDAGLRFAVGIIILIVGLALCKIIKSIVKRIMKRSKQDEAIIHFVASMVDVILKIVVLIAALATMGINTGSIITVLGTCGVAIGLALKDSLGNIAAGVMVIINKTFKKGDYIVCGDKEGIVQTINLFNTTLLTFDNVEVIIPNGILATNAVLNNTAMDTRRVDLKFNIAKESDFRFVKECVFEVTDKFDKVMNTPEAACLLDGGSDSYITIVVRAWCLTADYWDVYFGLQEKIRDKFIEKGIKVPCQQIEVVGK